MLNQETSDRIRKYLLKNVPAIEKGDMDEIQKTEFPPKMLHDLLEFHEVVGKDADDLIASVETMKETTAITRAPQSGLTWTTAQLICMVSVVVGMLIVTFILQSCRHGHNKNEDAVTRIDAAVSNLQAVVDGMPKKADLDTAIKAGIADIKTAQSNTDKKLDGLATSVDALTKSTAALVVVTNTLVENTSKLATTQHLRRVERKLDAHIAAEAKEKETTPAPDVDKQPASAAVPTHKVTLRHVPVYIDVYKPRTP